MPTSASAPSDPSSLQDSNDEKKDQPSETKLNLRKKAEKNYVVGLRIRSITKANRWEKSYLLFQAISFPLYNVLVNWFSLQNLLEDKAPQGLIDFLNIWNAFNTTFSNYFSKVAMSISKPQKVLELNSDQNFIFKRLWNSKRQDWSVKTFYALNDASIHKEPLKREVVARPSQYGPPPASAQQYKSNADSGDETAIDMPAERKTKTISDDHTITVLCINSNDIETFNTHSNDYRNLEALVLILKKTYAGLEAIDYDNETELQKQLQTLAAENPQKNFILVSSRKITIASQLQNIKEIIVYSSKSWGLQLYDNFIQCQPLSFIWNSIKACLALLRWSIAKGFPGLVVFLTGIHSQSKVFGIQNTSSYATRTIALIIFSLASWIGKTRINNVLKGNGINKEIRSLINHMRNWIRPDINWAAFIISLVVSLLSSIPYNAVTAYFYTVKGMETVLSDYINFLLGTSIELKEWQEDGLTFCAVVTSVILSISTGLIPLYKAIDKGWKPADSRSKQATKYYKKIWRLFIATVCGDSLGFGANAIFNTVATIAILASKHPGLKQYFDDNPALPDTIAVVVGLGNFLQAVFWCFYKGSPAFYNSIKILKELYKDMGGEVADSRIQTQMTRVSRLRTGSIFDERNIGNNTDKNATTDAQSTQASGGKATTEKSKLLPPDGEHYDDEDDSSDLDAVYGMTGTPINTLGSFSQQ